MALRSSQQVRREVDELIRSQQASLFLEYASGDPNEGPFTYKHFQHRGSIPAGGVLEIRDEYRVDKKNAYDKVRKGIEPKRTLKGPSASEVASHVLSVGRDRGVFLRTGDAVEDGKRREEARRAWRRHRMQADEKIVNRYREETEAFRENPRNVNKPVRLMDKAEAQAYARLERFRQEDLGIQTEGRFVCGDKHCGYWTLTASEMDSHRRVSGHPAGPLPTGHGPTSGPVLVPPSTSTVPAIEVRPGEEGLSAEAQAEMAAYEEKQAARRRERQNKRISAVQAEIARTDPDLDEAANTEEGPGA